ncbi:MAG: ABC transporter substrate-binding protein [Saprospiraceae bacterium]|nr:ABC transporter substrate-binding protein [Saprospiraceae bacterium]
MIVIDQIGNSVPVASTERIVSLVPSQTLLLYDLGLDNQVVGITKFCIQPKHWLKTKKIIGGTKNIDIAKVARLNPTLIIANKEENEKSQIELLQKQFPVWVSDINNLADSLMMIHYIGVITQTSIKAEKIIANIRHEFNKLRYKAQSCNVAYFIWRKPYMVAGKNTFINELINFAGWHNVFSNKQRYSMVTKLDIAQAKPDVILLSSEPYPFKEKHIEEFKIIAPEAIILIVKGETFTWYGSYLQYSPNEIISIQQQIQCTYTH